MPQPAVLVFKSVGSLNFLTSGEKAALQQFKEKVRGICGSGGWEIRVFGSRARGEGDEESDLDILVLVERLDEKRKVRIWDAAYDIFAATEIFLSPLVLSPDQFEKLKVRERLIALDIEREGIPL